MIHELKCWPEYFQAVKRNEKPFEVRYNDRKFAVGDVLLLREYDPATCDYTGDKLTREVTYVLDMGKMNIADPSQFVVMGIANGEIAGIPMAEESQRSESGDMVLSLLNCAQSGCSKSCPRFYLTSDGEKCARKLMIDSARFVQKQSETIKELTEKLARAEQKMSGMRPVSDAEIMHEIYGR